jgi:uncharacterized protein YdaU (DUF1376 family)
MMPFWVKDWIAAVQGWPGAERGAYISLLAHQWCNGFVPQDVSQLARITGFSEVDFERMWLTVGEKFDCDARGLFNPRLEEHRKEALRLRDARTLGASLANEKRRAKRLARSDESEDAERDAHTTHPSPSPSPSNGRKKEEETRRSASAQRVPRGTSWDDDQWLNFKIEFPHRAGGQPWERAKKACRARLAAGATWEEIISGATRYAKYCESAGKIGTELVMQAATFLGPDKRYLEDWEIPPEASDARWSPDIDPPDAANGVG